MSTPVSSLDDRERYGGTTTSDGRVASDGTSYYAEVGETVAEEG